MDNFYIGKAFNLSYYLLVTTYSKIFKRLNKQLPPISKQIIDNCCLFHLLNFFFDLKKGLEHNSATNNLYIPYFYPIVCNTWYLSTAVMTSV